jgi:myosin protein heavy chain
MYDSLFCRDVSKAKLDALEKEARQAKDQITELSRTATDYEAMLQRKESDIARLNGELAGIRREREDAVKQCAELEGEIDTLAKELDAQREDSERDSQSRNKLQNELDELRALMRAKASEDTQRAEAEKSREQEISVLRTQVSELGAELASVRRQATEAQNKLRVDLETVHREKDNLKKSLKDLKSVSSDHQAKLSDAEAALANAEKAKRATEAELQAMRTRQIETDNELEEIRKGKEVGFLCHSRPENPHLWYRRSRNRSPPQRRSIKTSRTQFSKLSARNPPGFDRWTHFGRSSRRRRLSVQSSRNLLHLTVEKSQSSRIQLPSLNVI